MQNLFQDVFFYLSIVTHTYVCIYLSMNLCDAQVIDLIYRLDLFNRTSHYLLLFLSAFSRFSRLYNGKLPKVVSSTIMELSLSLINKNSAYQYYLMIISIHPFVRSVIINPITNLFSVEFSSFCQSIRKEEEEKNCNITNLSLCIAKTRT